MTPISELRRDVLKTGAAAAAWAARPRWASAQASRLPEQIAAAAEPLPPIEDEGFAAFADRFADAKVVLLGEETHGTDEFYRARAAITERLIREHGFDVIAVEADYPDAARIDAYIRGQEMIAPLTPFQRFPVWMWRNRAVRDFVDNLHALNEPREPEAEVGFYGIDLYSLPSSMDAVVSYVRRYDPDALEEVRRRYGCLAPYVDDPAAYGALARRPSMDSCAEEVASVVEEVMESRMDGIKAADPHFFDALINARVVASSEAYYRAMYEGSVASWNLRDTHMFDTLKAILQARGPNSKAVVWAHNSHIGDASATEMGWGGELNIGQLAREEWGERARLIGFGTATGTVTAASDWSGPTETKLVRPPIDGSWGEAMAAAGPERFFLDLRDAGEAFEETRPERFIGVIYRPGTERFSHYADARLGEQFDGYVWFQTTTAVEPLPAEEIGLMPETYPFAL